jgi:hypothetical protein
VSATAKIPMSLMPEKFAKFDKFAKFANFDPALEPPTSSTATRRVSDPSQCAPPPLSLRTGRGVGVRVVRGKG